MILKARPYKGFGFSHIREASWNGAKDGIHEASDEQS